MRVGKQRKHTQRSLVAVIGKPCVAHVRRDVAPRIAKLPALNPLPPKCYKLIYEEVRHLVEGAG